MAWKTHRKPPRCPLADFKNTDGRCLTGASHLYRIMMTESSHLIWRLCCERRIDQAEQDDPTQLLNDINRKWMAVMNARLTLDHKLTRAKYVLYKTKTFFHQTGLMQGFYSLYTEWSGHIDETLTHPLDTEGPGTNTPDLEGGDCVSTRCNEMQRKVTRCEEYKW
ncbi:hypothetical protein BC835DRAFT_1309426 [Cytidiella melzeri]|nr:hypothetical protein BC835DRAFT_1309426 [Cytidiella melzeri]